VSEYPRAFIRWIQHIKDAPCHHRWHAHVLMDRADTPDEDNLVATGETPIITPDQIKNIEVHVKAARIEALKLNDTTC
jgi:hypothetical protein